MSGIFEKLKDAGKDALGTFVVMDEDGEQPADQTASSPGAVPAVAAASSAPAATGTVAVPSVSAAPDPEFVQQLRAAVDGSKKTQLPQFRALFGALGAVADEGTRTQLALAAAQASHGFGAAELGEAIADRLRILAGQKSEFEKALADETTQSVGATQTEIEKTRAEIARRIEEIKALESRAAELDQKAKQARASIDANAARFAASYAVVQAELDVERKRIEPFLTTPK